MSEVCPTCNGRKTVNGSKCGTCSGTGRVDEGGDGDDVVSAVAKAVGDVVEAAGDILDPTDLF